MNDTPEPPKPSDIHKFEVREQPGMTKNQAEHATAWLNLTQLLEKVVFILNGKHLDEIVTAASTADDIPIGEVALRQNEKWKEIFEDGLKHHRAVLDNLTAQRDVAVKMRDLIAVMARLKSDDRIIAEAERLVKVLDALEVHRKSGLLETISKL